MLKKTTLIFLSFIILFTTYLPGTSKTQKAEAFSYYSCDLLIESFDRTRLYIRNSLVPGYYQNMHYAQIYPSYQEEFLDLADRALEHIMSYTLSLIQDMVDLPGCAEFESIDDEEKLSLIGSLYNLLSDSTLAAAFTEDKSYSNFNFRYTKRNYYNLFYNYLYTMHQLQDKMGIENLLDKIIPNDLEADNKVFDILNTVVENSYDTFIDLSRYRQPSFEETDDLGVETVLLLDAVTMLINDIKNVKDYSKFDTKYTITKNPITSLFGGKALDSLKRGALTELINHAIQGQIPGPEQEFLADFASNLAALSTAGNRWGAALVYAELNADLWDHVNKNLKPVFDGANATLDNFNRELSKDKDAYNSVVFKQRALKTANNIMTAKMDSKYNDETFSTYLVEQIYELQQEAKHIYQLNPDEIKIYLDGQKLSSDIAPFIQNNTTMVPLRLISEALDINPKWNSKSQTITFTTTRAKNFINKEVDIVLTVGSTTAKIHTRSITLDSAPVTRNGTTFVPLRFIAESLSLQVKWIAEGNHIVLTSK